MTGVLAAVVAPGGLVPECVPAFVSGLSSDPIVFSDSTTFQPSASSYSWSRVSGDVLTVANPSSQTTSFRKDMSPGETAFSVYRCMTPKGSADVTVSLERIF